MLTKKGLNNSIRKLYTKSMIQDHVKEYQNFQKGVLQKLTALEQKNNQAECPHKDYYTDVICTQCGKLLYSFRTKRDLINFQITEAQSALKAILKEQKEALNV